MITYYLVVFLVWLLGILLFPITKLPDVTLPSSINAAFTTASTWFGLVWSVAPLTFVALFASLVVVVGIETHIFSYKTIKWLYNKIPGVN